MNVEKTPPAFRERILEAMLAQGMTKAELARLSGVKYHALDKFLKGASAKTSAENVQALSQALGIKADGEAEFDRLRQMFYQLSESHRQFVLESVAGLLGQKP